MKRTLLMVLFFALPVYPALAAGAIDSTAALVPRTSTIGRNTIMTPR